MTDLNVFVVSKFIINFPKTLQKNLYIRFFHDFFFSYLFLFNYRKMKLQPHMKYDKNNGQCGDRSIKNSVDMHKTKQYEKNFQNGNENPQNYFYATKNLAKRKNYAKFGKT